MPQSGPDLSVAVPTLEPDDQLVSRLAAAAVRSTHAHQAGSPVTGPLAWRVAAAAASVAVVTTGAAYAAGVIGRERTPDTPSPAVTHPTTQPSEDAAPDGSASDGSVPVPQTSSQPPVTDPAAGPTSAPTQPTGPSGGEPSAHPTGQPAGPPTGLPTPSAHPTGPPTAHPTGPPGGLPTPSARPDGPPAGRPAPGR